MKYIRSSISFMFVHRPYRLHPNRFHNNLFRNMTNQNQWSNPKEIQIPVSYGFIAAKAWGNEEDEPVLAFHGWQDNAGTFDRLIPKLTSQMYIVAIDTPGHGLSSHKPYGSFYHFLELLVDVKKVVDHFKWDKFSIIAHSMGGALALMFASVFPEYIKKLVILDTAKPFSRNVNELPNETRKGVIGLIDIERKISNPTPVYSIEEAKKRLQAGMFSEITSESADVLLKRGCQPSKCGKGVIFTRDIRVKMIDDLLKFSHEDMKAYMKRIHCDLLMIIATDSLFKSRSPEVVADFLNIYKDNCRTFDVVQVKGNHFVHLNNPDRVAPHIDAFFKKHNTELCKI